MTFLRWFFMSVQTILLGLASFFLAFIPPRGWAINLLGRPWSRGLLRIWGVRLRADTLLGGTPRIIMANHTSLLDIPVLFAALPDRLAFMAKKSLFKVPVLGWTMAVGGFIPVDRVDRSGALATLKLAKRRLEEGFSIIIFPEETRSDGKNLLPFKKGGFLLARMAGVPILPVGLTGASQIMTEENTYLGPGRVTVRFGEEIFFDKGMKVEEKVQAVQEQIERLADPSGPSD